VPQTRDIEQLESQFMARRLRGRKIKPLHCDSSSYLKFSCLNKTKLLFVLKPLASVFFSPLSDINPQPAPGGSRNQHLWLVFRGSE